MASGGEGFRRFLAQRWSTALVSILLAVALWWYIGRELTSSDTFPVSVEIALEDTQLEEWRFLDKPLTPSGSVVKQVRVEVEGPRQLIAQLADQQTLIKAVATLGGNDLAGQTEAEITFSLNATANVRYDLPSLRLKIVDIQPGALPVKLGRLSTQRVTVDFLDPDMKHADKVTGVLSGHFVETVGVMPPRVKVVGPLSALADLRLRGKLPVLPLERIDVSGAKGIVVQYARLAKSARAAGIRWARDVDPPTVTVVIRQKLVKRRLEVGVRWQPLELPEGFRYEQGQQTLEVEIQGPKGVVSRVAAADLAIYAHPVRKGDLDPKAPINQLATLAYLPPSTEKFPGVTIVSRRPNLPFKIVPIPKPTPPNSAGTGAGEGEKPPGGNGDGKGAGGNGAPRRTAKSPDGTGKPG